MFILSFNENSSVGSNSINRSQTKGLKWLQNLDIAFIKLYT